GARRAVAKLRPLAVAVLRPGGGPLVRRAVRRRPSHWLLRASPLRADVHTGRSGGRRDGRASSGRERRCGLAGRRLGADGSAGERRLLHLPIVALTFRGVLSKSANNARFRLQTADPSLKWRPETSHHPCWRNYPWQRTAARRRADRGRSSWSARR